MVNYENLLREQKGRLRYSCLRKLLCLMKARCSTEVKAMRPKALLPKATPPNKKKLQKEVARRATRTGACFDLYTVSDSAQRCVKP